MAEVALARRRGRLDGSGLVFPIRSGRAISPSTLPKMLHYHAIAAVPHGFRSSFRDWTAEEADHPREVVEAALAHVVQNKVEAVYARSDLFERRRLTDDWSEYLEGIDLSPLNQRETESPEPQHLDPR